MRSAAAGGQNGAVPPLVHCMHFRVAAHGRLGAPLASSPVTPRELPHPALRPGPPPRAVQPHPSASGFAVVRSNLPSDSDKGLPFHTYELPALGALPRGGRLLDTPLWNSVVRVAPAVPFADGALDFGGVSGAGRGCARAGLTLGGAASSAQPGAAWRSASRRGGRKHCRMCAACLSTFPFILSGHQPGVLPLLPTPSVQGGLNSIYFTGPSLTRLHIHTCLHSLTRLHHL